MFHPTGFVSNVPSHELSTTEEGFEFEDNDPTTSTNSIRPKSIKNNINQNLYE